MGTRQLSNNNKPVTLSAVFSVEKEGSPNTPRRYNMKSREGAKSNTKRGMERMWRKTSLVIELHCRDEVQKSTACAKNIGTKKDVER